MTEQLVRLSRGASGYISQGTENANSQGASIPIQLFASELISSARATSGLAVSDDGAEVLFMSTGALTPEAQAVPEAGTKNLYEYSSTVDDGGSIADGDVYLISSGVNTQERGLDPSGQDIFFQTAIPLVPQDTDTQSDLYDARVDGGFSEPELPSGCSACEDPPVALVPDAPAMPASTVAVTPTPTESPPTPVLVTKTPAASKAARLRKALMECHARKHKRVRVLCEVLAKKKLGSHASKGSARRATR
jgi:hypothetical protein